MVAVVDVAPPRETTGTSEVNIQPFIAFSILFQKCNGVWCFACFPPVPKPVSYSHCISFRRSQQELTWGGGGVAGMGNPLSPTHFKAGLKLCVPLY